MDDGQRGSNKGPLLSQLVALLSLLSSLESGSVTVSVNALPMAMVDADSKSLGIEVSGVKESGLRLSEMLVGDDQERSIGKLIASSASMATSLSKIGWTVTLYDKGHSLLSMGKGASGLTGHIKANPLRLRELLRAL